MFQRRDQWLRQVIHRRFSAFVSLFHGATKWSSPSNCMFVLTLFTLNSYDMYFFKYILIFWCHNYVMIKSHTVSTFVFVDHITLTLNALPSSSSVSCCHLFRLTRHVSQQIDSDVSLARQSRNSNLSFSLLSPSLSCYRIEHSRFVLMRYICFSHGAEYGDEDFRVERTISVLAPSSCELTSIKLMSMLIVVDCSSVRSRRK